MKQFYILLLILSSLCIKAQQNEVGLLLGGTYYNGDINPTIPLMNPQVAIGLLYRYNVNKRISFRTHAFRGSVIASDASINYNPNRNLSFKSTITEVAMIMEINYLKFLPGLIDYPASTYVFGGPAFFSFNPKASYEGKWYDLQPLKTEGYEKASYARYNIALPFGVGIKFNLSSFVVLSVEWGVRKTFTDYLDDVSTVYPDSTYFINADPMTKKLSDRSPELNKPRNKGGTQRGNSANKDWYAFTGISLSVKINNKKAPCNAFEKHKDYNRIINFDKINLNLF